MHHVTIMYMFLTARHTLAFFLTFCMSIFFVNGVYAQSTWERLSLKGLVDILIQGVAGVLIPLAVTILFFIFVYGIVVYMRAANKGDSKMADLAKTRLLYGVIVLFAVFSIWGFVHLLRNLFSG